MLGLSNVVNERAEILFNDIHPAEYAIKEAFGDLGDTMVKIAECESHLSQFDRKGNPVKGKDGEIGLFQIYPRVWGNRMEELGIDIYTFRGNVEAAKVVLNEQGLKAWACYK